MAKFNPIQLAEWVNGSWHNGIPESVDGVSADSRKLARGNIFIAIRGPNFDGHDFVIQALRQGACGAVVARSDLIKKGLGPFLVVNDTTQALWQMAARYRRALDIRIIAVTGSVGKTTVKEMVAGIFARRMATAKTIGNWNNEFGLPLSILNMDPSSRIGVFELGVNHPGELFPLSQLLKPDWGIVTAVGPVHLEYFGSEKAVAEEKSVLIKSLPENGIAFLGRDHNWFELLNSAACCRVISTGEHKDSDYVLLECGHSDGETKILERQSGDVFSFRLPLPGRHIAANAILAIAMARTNEFDWQVIREGLEAYQPQPMRWQSENFGGIFVINDAYNANPISMATALKTFKAFGHGEHKWLVLAGMHELGAVSEEEHKKLGMIVAHFQCSGLVTVGLLGNIIAGAAEKAGMKKDNIFRCKNHMSAAKILFDSVRPGDAVLFKASRCERLEKVLEIWKKSS